MNSSVLQSNFRFFSLNNLYRRFSFFGHTPDAPLFPDFKSVTRDDKALFDTHMRSNVCYSDFNFNSFHSWNTHDAHEFSILNDNLVIKLADYITDEPFFSLIGTNNVDESLTTLIEFSDQLFGHRELKLIPRHTIRALKQPERFTVTEDPANHDYVISLALISEFKGRQFKSKRHAAARCARDYNVRIEDHSRNPEIYSAILEAARDIAAEKDTPLAESERELMAIARILESVTMQENLRLTVAIEKKDIVGFSVDELLPRKFVQSHYFKTSRNIPGLAEFLNQHIATKFYQQGYAYWNWEQDLGLESLRRMKQAHRPVQQLKKYIVTTP